jgi:small-conductance mechanosensitive channel
MITAPNHPGLRFLKISDKEAISMHRKFLRIVAVSFSAAAASSLFPMHGHFLGILIIVCYFLEIKLSEKPINKMLLLTKSKNESFSCRLVAFINQKIAFICLFAMFFVIFVNQESKKIFFFKNLSNIYCVLAMIFLLQAFTSSIINKIMAQLDSVKNGIHSKLTAKKRQKNLTWICDIIIIVFYLFAVYMFLKHIGVTLHKRIFHDTSVTVGGIIFVTVIIYRGFNEFADTILEKAKVADQSDYEIKLKTFLPPLSAIFYTLLFVISGLLILSNLKINIAPILAAFTVFSAAIGLAAQDIIRSFLHGITFLIEKNIYIGAYIKIDQRSGVVEKLSTRVLYLRDDSGSVHVIPYSAIGAVTNCSENYLYYHGELTFCAEDDIATVSQLLTDVVSNMRKEERYKEVILSDVEIHGLKPFDFTGPKICWRIKTMANACGKAVKYEIFKRLYAEYKKHGIRIPTADCTMISV